MKIKPIGHLVKTNPIKPNQTQFQNTFSKTAGRQKGLWEAAEKAILFFLCRKTGQTSTI
ncbi:MAG: hypothetical protein HQ580_06160 [Planctomycetes bacterium]|nr:hypothetical protein [Planctomycetota bacterium]